MKFPILLIFALLVSLLSACKTETPINGDVFVVTKGAGNYKLGDVQVSAISEKDLNASLIAVKDSFELSYENRYQLSDFLFTIPTAAKATTNSDGKFSLKLPTSGAYYLLARSQRSTGEDTEYYLWLQKVIADGKEQTVMLSNNNLTEPLDLQAIINLAK